MFHVEQFVIIYENVPRETMQNVPRETFFPCFLPVGGLSGADFKNNNKPSPCKPPTAAL